MMRPRTASEREMHGETPQVGTISFGAGPSLAGQLALDMSKLNAQIFRSEERKQLEMRIIERMAPKLIGYMRDDWPKLAKDVVHIAKLVADAYFADKEQPTGDCLPE